MKRAINILLALTLAAICLSVCARAAMRICDTAGIIALFRSDDETMSASKEIKTHNLGALQFNGIEASSAAMVTVREAGNPNRDVILRVSENLAEHIEMKVRGDILEIGFKRNFNLNGLRLLGNFTFEVSVPHSDELSSLTAAGSAQIDVASPLTAVKVALKAAGASRITAPVECTMCEVEAAGASKIILTGHCTKLEAGASGASKIDAEQCESINCAAEAVGASKVTVWCTGTLSANAVGASKVAYRGDCTLKKSAFGASSVKKMD